MLRHLAVLLPGIILLGCVSNGHKADLKAQRASDLIRMLEALPASVRDVYTPERWELVEEIFNGSQPTDEPKDLPFRLTEHGQDSITARLELANCEWRQSLGGYYIVKGDTRCGPHVCQICLYQRHSDGTWREVLWMSNYFFLWDVGLDEYEPNLEHYLDGVCPELAAARYDLLQLALFMAKPKADANLGRWPVDFATTDGKMLAEYLPRLHAWGIVDDETQKMMDYSGSIRTTSSLLNELLRWRSGSAYSWSRVDKEKHYFVVMFQQHGWHQEGEQSQIGYALLEKQGDGSFVCHALVLWEAPPAEEKK